MRPKTKDIRYYKGVHKVRVMTKSEGYWIVEALEDFQDTLNDKRVHVRVGDRRIAQVGDLSVRKTLPPMVKEHVYELKMEKKLKRIVASEEEKKARNRASETAIEDL